MLIKNTPDVYEELRHLGGIATDDVLSPSEYADGAARPVCGACAPNGFLPTRE